MRPYRNPAGGSVRRAEMRPGGARADLEICPTGEGRGGTETDTVVFTITLPSGETRGARVNLPSAKVAAQPK